MWYIKYMSYRNLSKIRLCSSAECFIINEVNTVTSLRYKWTLRDNDPFKEYYVLKNKKYTLAALELSFHTSNLIKRYRHTKVFI